MPSRTLPVRPAEQEATLWVVGTHGGAGESSVAALDEDWRAADHGWVMALDGSPTPCVVVARTNYHGLTAAQDALTQWAASGVDDSVCLLGLVLVADAPGKLPPALRDLAKVVGGGAPRVWELPWQDEWRQGAEPSEVMPRAAKKLVSDLRSLAAEATASAENDEIKE